MNRRSTYSLSLLALSGMAVGMPLLDLFGRYAQFFIAQDQYGSEIVLFSLLITFLIPLAALALEAFVRMLSKPAGQGVHVLLIFIFGTALGLAVLRKLPVQYDALILAMAILAGGAIAYAEQRSAAMQRGLAFLSLAPLAALAYFLFFSACASLIWKGGLFSSGETGAAIAQGIGRPAPVVILALDEFPIASLMLPDGSINAERFPNFARLAGESYWFRNASSVAPWTGASLTSVLTGQMPLGGKAPNSIDYPQNLFSLLGTAYQMEVHEEQTRFCPPDLCQELEASPAASSTLASRMESALLDAGVVYAHASLPPGMRERLPSLSFSWGGYAGQDSLPPSPVDEGQEQPPGREDKTGKTQIAHLENFIASVQPSPAPVLYFTHVVLPHFPWELTPTGYTYTQQPALYDQLSAIPGLKKEGDHWGGNAFLVRQGLQRHLLQVGYVDSMIGKLIDRMQATGVWDQTLVIVFADHGVSFVPDHPRRGPTPETLDEIYRVPLFIKVPGQSAGVVRDDNAMLLDVLPSLVDVLDIQTGWTFAGRSLFGDAPPPPEKRITEAPGGKIPAGLEGLFRVVSRNAAIFHQRNDWIGIASVGEHGEWVGQHVSELNVAWDDRISWTIDQQQEFGKVNFHSGYVPILVTGELVLPQDMPPPPEVIIVLNGVVAGIGGGFDCHVNTCSFSALLAEELLHDGANQLEVRVMKTAP
jgi:hypothetical protein